MDSKEAPDSVFRRTFVKSNDGSRSCGNRRRFWLIWLWLLLTLALDCLQFLLFDCSELPVLSLLFGFPAIGAAAALPIMLVANWTNDSRPLATKLLLSVLLAVGLLAIVCLAGIVMLFTHLAP
jgi:hypothetical protein